MRARTTIVAQQQSYLLENLALEQLICMPQFGGLWGEPAMTAKIRQNCADCRLTVVPALPAAHWAASLQDTAK